MKLFGQSISVDIALTVIGIVNVAAFLIVVAWPALRQAFGRNITVVRIDDPDAVVGLGGEWPYLSHPMSEDERSNLIVVNREQHARIHDRKVA